MFRVKLRPQLKEFYWFQVLFSFAFSLVVIFEPIFFYKEGFSLQFIALYYAIHYAVYTFLLPLGGMFVSRFGLERSLTVSLPIFIGYFVTLSLVDIRSELVWVALALLTVHKVFYWPAFMAEMARFGDGHNRGTELAWLGALRYGVGILGPLMGGVVASVFGFPILFLVAAGMVMVSSVPLLRTKERFRTVFMSYTKPWRLMWAVKNRRLLWAMMGLGENLVDMVFWPIFMFIVLGSASKLGALVAVGVAVMTVVTFLVGEMADRVSRRTVLRLHVPFLAVSYLFRPLAAGVTGVVLTDTLGRMAFTGVNLPLSYYIYTRAKRQGVVATVVSIEMMLSIAKALTALVLVIVFGMTLPFTGLVVAFGLAAVLSLFYFIL